MKKLNNKGFSLVELIIVIAIMAILVGVVGTQVIPYLEQSRISKDIQVLSAWNTDAVSAYSANAAKVDASKTYTFTIAQTGLTVSNGSDSCSAKATSPAKDVDYLYNSFADIAGTVDLSVMESKAIKEVIANAKVVITLKPGAKAEVKVTKDGTTEITEFIGAVENK